MMKLFYTITLLVPFFLSPFSTVNADITNTAVQIPGNLAGWYVCSNSSTGTISYSMRVVSAKAPTQPNAGTMIPALPTSANSQNISASAMTLEMTKSNVPLYIKGGQFVYADSLSCAVKPVTKCDQDTGSDPLTPAGIQCLVIANPTSQPINVNTTYSFDESVFGNKNFTSPEVNGGNSSVPTNGTSSNPSANSTNGSSSTYGNDPSSGNASSNSNSNSSNTASPQANSANVAKTLSGYVSAGAVVGLFLAFGGLGI